MLEGYPILLMEIPMTNRQPWKRVSNTLIAIMLPVGAAIGATMLAATGATSAQAYPARLIKVICPFPSGGVVDVVGRLVTPGVSSRLGVPVILDNRPGGGATIGTREVARAAPDGHTLLLSGETHAFAFGATDFDPVKDFVPIASVATTAWILVVASATPARSVKEFIVHAKANPGKLAWGFGQGGGPHVFGEMFKIATGIDVAGIPYRSGTQAVPDMLGGRIDMNFGTVSNLLPLIREGKLRALAVTSASRSRELPNVPTMAESGFPQLTRGGWVGFWAPTGTATTIVDRINREINAGMTTIQMADALKQLDFEPRVGSPQEFAAFIRDEIVAWTPAARAAGMLPK
jgi:tripartite-type tricarboxylate transporter receptor subunit TctC